VSDQKPRASQTPQEALPEEIRARALRAVREAGEARARAAQAEQEATDALRRAVIAARAAGNSGQRCADEGQIGAATVERWYAAAGKPKTPTSESEA